MKTLQTILVTTLLLVSFSAQAIENEDHYNRLFCEEMQGKAEYTLEDLSRVDCLTDTHAFEADWADGLKVYEAIGQALYYASETGRLPGILLLIRYDAYEKHIRKVERVIEMYPDLKIKLIVRDVRTTGPNIEYFEVLNLTSIDDQYFADLLNFSASKIKNIPADQNTLAVFIPRHVLTKTQIDNVLKEIDGFQAKTGCFNPQAREGMRRPIRDGIQTFSVGTFCGNNKLMTMIFEEARKPPNASITTSRDHILSLIIQHEAYHSFQKNIGKCNGFDVPHDAFLVEGGAEYFSIYYQLALENRLDEFDNHILEEVMRRGSDSRRLVHEGVPHMKGLAAINLMIQKGWVEQSSILDGSFYDDCKGARQLLIGDEKLNYLNDNWYKIEKHEGNYRFNTLLSFEEAMDQRAMVLDIMGHTDKIKQKIIDPMN